MTKLIISTNLALKVKKPIIFQNIQNKLKK
jgi:hypothetical protein